VLAAVATAERPSRRTRFKCMPSSNRIRLPIRWKSLPTRCATISSDSISGAGYSGEPDPLQPRRREVGAAGSQHDPDRRAVLSSAAREHSRSVPLARMLAIGGMTAIFRTAQMRSSTNSRSENLERDKKNESACLFDGRGPETSGQTRSRSSSFPIRIKALREARCEQSSGSAGLSIEGVGTRSPNGTRAAVRTVIRFVHGLLMAAAPQLLDGYMEILATDRSTA